MATIKHPVVAGTFYPSDAQQLQKMLSDFLASSQTTDLAVPKAIIAPHAGYIYSGPIAANIYATLLETSKHNICKIILLGPSHYVYFHGLATTKADWLLTPLGKIPVDQSAIYNLIEQLPFVHYLEEAFSKEHSLEVHLPFLQTVLQDFTIVPLVVGKAQPQQVAEAIEMLWGDDETLIVVSSDLSHFHDYQTAKKMDWDTSLKIAALTTSTISPEQACGHMPIQGLLLAARNHKLRSEIVDVRNSGDTAGNKDRVVGYGAYHFC